MTAQYTDLASLALLALALAAGDMYHTRRVRNSLRRINAALKMWTREGDVYWSIDGAERFKR